MGKRTIIIAVAVVILVASLAFFFLVKTSETPESQTPEPTESVEGEIEVKELNASDIGLTVTPRSDAKAIIMKVTKLSGISSIEYEATYDAEVREGKEVLKVGRGVGPSTIEIKPNEMKITREILLGSCSKNVCKYDLGVTEVEFVVKVNYENGEVGSITQKVSL